MFELFGAARGHHTEGLGCCRTYGFFSASFTRTRTRTRTRIEAVQQFFRLAAGEPLADQVLRDARGHRGVEAMAFNEITLVESGNAGAEAREYDPVPRLDHDFGSAVYAVTKPTQHGPNLAGAVTPIQYLGAAAQHDEALRIDLAGDAVGCTRQVRASASGNDLFDAALRVELDAEAELLNPGLDSHENKMRTCRQSVKPIQGGFDARPCRFCR